MILSLCGMMLLTQWACVKKTGPFGYPKPGPLAEKYRQQLSPIGVVTHTNTPVIRIDSPLSPQTPGILERMGKGATKGAGKSWQWWKDNVLVPEAWTGPGLDKLVLIPLAFILIVPVAIFGGIGGGIGELARAETPVYIETNQAILQNILASFPIQKTFQSSFLKEARVQNSYTFVVVPEQGLPTTETLVSSNVETILELTVQKLWLKRTSNSKKEISSSMAWVLVVHVRLFGGTDRSVWYDQTFVHETGNHPYQVWPYYNRVQAAIKKAYQNLAEQVVRELFVTTDFN